MRYASSLIIKKIIIKQCILFRGPLFHIKNGQHVFITSRCLSVEKKTLLERHNDAIESVRKSFALL